VTGGISRCDWYGVRARLEPSPIVPACTPPPTHFTIHGSAGLSAPGGSATLATVGSGLAVAAALAFVFGTVLGPSRAGTPPLLAGFEARSYAAGQTAVLDIGGGTADRATLQLFLAGSPVSPAAKSSTGTGRHSARR
jgi:hypothetical protein